jgi:hypothetical protein
MTSSLPPPPGMKGNPAAQRRDKAFVFANLPDPLPQEIADTSEISRLHRDWKLVPYAGTVENSGDNLRAFLSSMAYLSPSHGACITNKKQTSLGKMTVRIRRNEDFVFGVDTPAPGAIAQKYLDFIAGVNLDGKSIKELAGQFHEDVEETGDQFIEIVVATTLGVRTYSLFRHRPANCKYVATAKGEQRFVAISPIWRHDYLKKNPPPVLPLFPAFITQADGTERSIIHRKNGKNEWYGRPPAFSSWMYQYREFQDSSYMVKLSNNNFTGQVIIEAEDDNPQQTDEDARNAGFRNEADRIAANFTSQSDDPMTVWYTTRPFGARAMFVEQIEPNTSHEFYVAMDGLNEKQIIRAHSWSKRLMEATEATGLSSNVFMDVLKSRLPVIANVQENAVAILNRAFQAIVIMEGRVEFQSLALGFISPYQEIIEQTEMTTE